jgi:hypothetical protein
VPYTFGTYRTLKLRVDFIARQLTYFVDGTQLGTAPFLSTIAADRLIGGYLFLNGPIDPIDTPELTYDRTNYTAYFDDYSLVSVPLSPVNAVVEFSSTNFLADEFALTAKVNLVRRGFTGAAVRVKVSTTNGTAVADEDYEGTLTYVTFAAGQTNGLGRLRMNFPLRIISTAHDPNGETRLTASVLNGHNYGLQSSSDLTHWNDLVTQTATTNRLEFIDRPPASDSKHFYRVKAD